MISSGVITSLRLFDVQLIRGAQFQEMADANRTFVQLLPRERGLILDRYGYPLVVNRALYYTAKDPDKLYSEKILTDRDSALRLMATESGTVTSTLQRSYPLQQAGAHILGYTGPVTADDLQKDKELHTTDLIGKQGLEKIFEKIMRGTSAKEVFEINAMGKKQRLLQTKVGEVGESIETTLDPYLLSVSQQALGEQTGSVVILDADNGEILSMVSSPSFDPNMFSDRFSDENQERDRISQVQAAFSHPKQLFFNRAISGVYPPGSVFKLVTALAGLSSGAIDESTSVLDEGVLKVGEYSYANWYFTQYGRVEGDIRLQKALARSNDIYFYKAAEFIGPTKLAEFAREFGFGSPTGVELQSEAGGTIPDPIWKEETLGERWFLGNTYHFGIGQGNVLVTPLQVAQMTQTIAHRGSRCSPHLIKQAAANCTGLPITIEDLNVVVDGMRDACSSGGTAFPFFPWNSEHLVPDEDGYAALSKGAIACKTGTAEFGSTDERGYKKTHGWFTMFVSTDTLLQSVREVVAAEEASASAELASSDQVASESGELRADSISSRDQWLLKMKKDPFPENIVITVLVESDEAQPYKEGSREAAPVAKAILDWMTQGVKATSKPAEVVVPPDALAE